ncbi:MAG: serine/threonine-protein kinase, partial [Gemmataceae bacterium]
MQIHQEHPSQEKLHAFAEGYLEEAEVACIQNHIAHCLPCLEMVKQIPADAFALKLRHAVGRTLANDYQGQNPLKDDPELTSRFLNHHRYLVRKKLGAGGMGTVYLAEHRLMRRLVALKVINQRLLAQPDALTRFQKEIQAIAQLDHPGIAVAHDAEEMDGFTILVMEYIDGLDLGRYVEKHGPLPVSTACNYILQAARALQYAHERGLIHRDIKPQNLMLTPDFRIKLLDFGLAVLGGKSDGESSRTPSGCETPFPGDLLTDFGQGIGTPAYAAPEQVQDAHTVDERADIFSLGATLNYLLTGKNHHSTEGILGPDVPSRLESFLKRMLATCPADRPASMKEVIRELATWDKESKRWQVDRRVVVGTLLVPVAGVVG